MPFCQNVCKGVLYNEQIAKVVLKRRWETWEVNTHFPK